MAVILMKDFVKIGGRAVRADRGTASPPAAERKASAHRNHGEAWYHEAAIAAADKTTPRPN